MKTLTFTYKNLFWESVELALRKHRLTRANIKRYGWKDAPEIELTEVVLHRGDKETAYLNKKGRCVRLKEIPYLILPLSNM